MKVFQCRSLVSIYSGHVEVSINKINSLVRELTEMFTLFCDIGIRLQPFSKSPKLWLSSLDHRWSLTAALSKLWSVVESYDFRANEVLWDSPLRQVLREWGEKASNIGKCRSNQPPFECWQKQEWTQTISATWNEEQSLRSSWKKLFPHRWRGKEVHYLIHI